MKVVKCKKFKGAAAKITLFLLVFSLLGGDSMKPCMQMNSSEVSSKFAHDAFYATKEYKQNLEIDNRDGYRYLCEPLVDDYYLVKQDPARNEIYCDGVEEAKKYLDVKNPTYDDVRALINAKNNIKDKYKEWLLKGLYNLQKKLPNLDLAILYYNIERMEIVELTSDEMGEKFLEPVVGYFDKYTGVVGVREDIRFAAFCHEIFGHATSLTFIKQANKKIWCSSSFIVLTNRDSDDYYTMDMGRSLEEAKSNLLGEIAAGYLKEYSYKLEREQFRMFVETCGVTLEDYVEYGPSYLVKKMVLNDVDDPLGYISRVDAFNDYYSKSFVEPDFRMDPEFKMSNNIKEYFKDYVDDKLERGERPEEIKRQVEKIFDNSSYETIEARGGYTLETVVMDDLEAEVIKEIEVIDQNKGHMR